MRLKLFSVFLCAVISTQLSICQDQEERDYYKVSAGLHIGQKFTLSAPSLSNQFEDQYKLSLTELESSFTFLHADYSFNRFLGVTANIALFGYEGSGYSKVNKDSYHLQIDYINFQLGLMWNLVRIPIGERQIIPFVDAGTGATTAWVLWNHGRDEARLAGVPLYTNLGVKFYPKKKIGITAQYHINSYTGIGNLQFKDAQVNAGKCNTLASGLTVGLVIYAL